MINFRRVIIRLFALLVVVLVVDPGDLIFHMKMPIFMLIWATWLILRTDSSAYGRRDLILVSLSFLAISIYGILAAVLQNNFVNDEFAFGFIKSISIFSLIFIIYDLRIDVFSIVSKWALIICGITLPIYIVITFFPALLSPIYNYVIAKDVAKIGYRAFYGVEIVMIYYRTSPLLVFSLCFFLDKYLQYKKIKFIPIAGIVFFTLFLTGTRANILMALIIAAFYFYRIYSKHFFAKIIYILGLLYAAVTFFSQLNFDVKDESSDVKGDHFNSYLELFDKNPNYLIHGQGLGSEFYSRGSAKMLPQTELTYLDLLRTFGFPVTILFLILLLYPIMYLFKNGYWQIYSSAIVAYLAYLFIAGTNPLLISSTGMIAVLVAYSFLKSKKNENFGMHGDL